MASHRLRQTPKIEGKVKSHEHSRIFQPADGPGGRGALRRVGCGRRRYRVANWNAQPTAVNAWVDNPMLVRARSEGEFRNNPWCRKIVDATLAAVIGASGLNPQFKDKAIADAWGAWADTCDAAGRLDWVQMLWLILQTVMVSGECFVRFGVNPDAAVPLTLLPLGPEFLDTSRVDGNTRPVSSMKACGASGIGCTNAIPPCPVP